MPALIPVHNTLGAFFIGTILSSTIYGITWLQVYSYYNNHSSRDRWPLKSFVAFLMLVDSANVAFIIQTNYHLNVTNFGDYQSLPFVPWITLSSYILEVSVELFYAYRIYRLSKGSPYLPAAISVVSLTSFAIGIFYCAKVLEHIHDLGNRFQGLSMATFGCKVLCDVLITFGMVHALLSNRSQVRRTNNVLNLLAIYTINCGALNLVFAISCVALLAKYRTVGLYVPSFFITMRLYFCGFMSILNSRDNLREKLDGPGGVVTFSQLKARTGTDGVQVTTETSTNVATPKSLPPVPSGTLISDIAFNRVKYPVPLPGVLTILFVYAVVRLPGWARKLGVMYDQSFLR
ncbi:hypothetical protein EDB85DRAFT_2273658 [Lactarius pseudohatsudake]|nr:hypothetical protein EDB85DRAFT_2273658 [Lactarius pseudohatsudake]